MSCFSLNKCDCDLKSIKKIKCYNSNVFWEQCDERSEINLKLFKTKTFYIHSKESQNVDFVLRIGMNPHHKFDIVCQLECKMTKMLLHISVDQMKYLFDYFNSMLQSDIKYPSNVDKRMVDHMEYQSIIFSATYDRRYKIKSSKKVMELDETSLISLMNMEPFASDAIDKLKMEQPNCKQSFEELIATYSYNKTVEEIMNERNQQEFLVHTVDNKCRCIADDFFIEISANFSTFFRKSVPRFIAATMIEESTRLQTFRSSSKLRSDIDVLAKTGFILAESNENNTKFRCMFCFTEMNENDAKNPIEAHFYLSGNKCPLLCTTPSTHNIPIVGTNFDLFRFFTSLLPIGYDTVY